MFLASKKGTGFTKTGSPFSMPLTNQPTGSFFRCWRLFENDEFIIELEYSCDGEVGERL